MIIQVSPPRQRSFIAFNDVHDVAVWLMSRVNPRRKALNSSRMINVVRHHGKIIVNHWV